MGDERHAGRPAPFARDVFISHANEDKDEIARPLAQALTERGLRVWFDEFALHVGQSLRDEIDDGLARSEFGVVILSPHFFAKRWTRRELNGLVARETGGAQDIILPVWHNVDRNAVAAFSVMLADRVAALSILGVDAVANRIVDAIGRARRARAYGDVDPPPLPSDRPGSTRTHDPMRIEWHPAAHQLWGDARLTWVRLAFSGAYDRTRALDGVRATLRTLGSTAYTYEELFLGYDGLLRVWLPRTLSNRWLRAELARNLPEKIRRIDTFDVHEIRRHWVWQAADGRGIRQPPPSVLRNGLESELISRASAGALNPRQLIPLLADNLVARVGGEGASIRFFVAFGPSDHRGRPRGDTPEWTDQLERIIDAAVGIDDPVLYYGVGFASYLITGKVSQYERLTTDVLEPVAELSAAASSRAYVMLAATASALMYRDEPALTWPEMD